MYKNILNNQYPNNETEKDFPCEVNRAAQFAPYAALTGFGDMVEETARLTQRRIEPDEGIKEELDRKIQYLRDAEKSTEISVVYFKPDPYKEGGAYVNHTGVVLDIREFEREFLFEGGLVIPVDDIYSIEINNQGCKISADRL